MLGYRLSISDLITTNLIIKNQEHYKPKNTEIVSNQELQCKITTTVNIL